MDPQYEDGLVTVHEAGRIRTSNVEDVERIARAEHLYAYRFARIARTAILPDDPVPGLETLGETVHELLGPYEQSVELGSAVSRSLGEERMHKVRVDRLVYVSKDTVAFSEHVVRHYCIDLRTHPWFGWNGPVRFDGRDYDPATAARIRDALPATRNLVLNAGTPLVEASLVDRDSGARLDARVFGPAQALGALSAVIEAALEASGLPADLASIDDRRYVYPGRSAPDPTGAASIRDYLEGEGFIG